MQTTQPGQGEPLESPCYTKSMTDDKFDKLFNYMVDMDKRLSGRLNTIESEVRGLYDAPDVIAKRLNDNDDEQAARDAQWSRLIEWARKVSEKTGIPLPDL